MPTPIVTIEAELGSILLTEGGNAVSNEAGVSLGLGEWHDISADVLRPINFRRGIDGSGPLDLVASTGTLNMRLINSARNSSGLLGYYSPDHANARANFDLGLYLRIKLDDGVNPAQYKFRGKISEITPSFGQKGERVTEVTAVDIMDEIATQKLDKLAVQENTRNDQIVDTLDNALPRAPLATSFSTGPDTFSFALHNDRDERSTLLSALQKAMQSGLDYLFPKGDTTGGETLVYQSRHDRIKTSTISATFHDNMRGLELKRSVDNIFNRLKVVSFPVEVDAAATTVLYDLQNEILIQPGQTFPLQARFRDPDNQVARISGKDIVDPLVADTDFKMSSLAEDGGNDLNAIASITLTIGANACLVEIENTGSIPGYLNKLQIRGKGIYHYDPVEYLAEDATSISAYGDRPLTFELPNNDNPNTGVDFGDHLLTSFKDPGSQIEGMRILGNRSASLLAAAVTLEPGDRISVTETATGVNSEFFIQGFDMSIRGKDIVEVDYVLKEAVGGEFWFLGDVSFSELGDTTILGF